MLVLMSCFHHLESALYRKKNKPNHSIIQRKKQFYNGETGTAIATLWKAVFQKKIVDCLVSDQACYVLLFLQSPSFSLPTPTL